MENVGEELKISCIVPVYNVEKVLARTLDSLINQTFKYIEIICVDDASTDFSLDILRQYNCKDNRIKIIASKKNSGAAISRNMGLKQAKGEYIIFLDSDDYFYPEMLEKAYTKIVECDADIVSFGFCQKKIEKNSNTIISTYNWEFPELILEGEDKNLSPWILHCVSPCNKLVKTQMLIDNGIEFQDIPTGNDVFYGLSTMYSAKRIVFIKEILFDYLVGREGCLSNLRNEKFSYWVCALEKIYFYLVDKKIAEDAVDNYLEFVMKTIVGFTDSFGIQNRELTVQLLLSGRLLEVLKGFVGRNSNYMYQIIMRDVCDNRELCSFDKYITEVAEDIMNKAEKKKLGVILWGCGKRGKYIVDSLDNKGKKIHYIVDTSQELRNSGYNGHCIFDYKDVAEDTDVIMVTNAKLEEEIKKVVVDKVVLNVMKYSAEMSL